MTGYGTPELPDMPAVLLTIGQWSVARLIRFRLSSTGDAPLDWLDVELDNPHGEAEDFVEDLPVELAIGYTSDKAAPIVFTGKVESIRRERTVVLTCVDDAYRLRDLVVTQSWRNVTPQEVAADLFQQAGFTAWELSGADVPRRGHVVSAGLTGLQLLDEMAKAWGLSWQFYAEPGNVVWWGPWNASPRAKAQAVVMFTAGHDVYELIPARGANTGKVIAHAAPLLQHTDLLLINDPVFGEEPALARADRVEHILSSGDDEDADGPLYRTEVEWTRVDSLI